MDSGSNLSFQHLDSDSCPQHNCNIIMVWKQKPVVLQRAPLCTRLYGTCVSLRLSKNGRLQVEGIDWYFWLSLSPGVWVRVCLYARAHVRAVRLARVSISDTNRANLSVRLTRSDRGARLVKPRVHIILIPLKMFWFKVVCILCCQGQSKRAIAGSAVSGARGPRGDNGI